MASLSSSDRTRSGWASARVAATKPPIELPATWARSIPRRSITAATRAACAGAEKPVPAGEAGRAVTGELGDDDAVVAHEVLGEAHPHDAVGGEAVQQHHRRCVRRTALEDGQRGVADVDAALAQAVRPRLGSRRAGEHARAERRTPVHFPPRERTTPVMSRW